jgi:hypothetical protein
MSARGGREYKKHERISLKAYPELNENWLQARIAEESKNEISVQR